MENETVVKESDLLVSMTDPRGKILYANDLFCKIANYNLTELIGQPHNMVRHPDVPKAIFKVFWDTALKGKPITAFVKNRVKDGGYYWVRAFVMPVVENGTITRILSYRHGISDASKEMISEIYKMLIDYEKSHSVEESLDYFMDFLDERNLSYDQFLNRVSNNKQVNNKFFLSIDKKQLLLDHLNLTLGVQSRRANGEMNFEVTKASNCAFGKFISSVSDRSITRSSAWEKLISDHNKFHQDLQNHANGQNSLENELVTLREEIFEDLQNIIDNAK